MGFYAESQNFNFIEHLGWNKRQDLLHRAFSGLNESAVFLLSKIYGLSSVRSKLTSGRACV